jgi:Tfp pilus assembly protein PilF
MHARRAVDLRPDYPLNQSALAEALAANGHGPASEEAYRRALDQARSMAAANHPDAAEWVEAIAEEFPR